MKAKFRITLAPEDLVQKLFDTGVTAWDGGFITGLRYEKKTDTVFIQVYEDLKYMLYMVPSADVLRVFNEFVHKMSFTVTDGELEDLDLDAATADEILQTVVFGEVVYA